ncbi:recombinase family protein [Serratia ficaria]|uniref:hypothetical protein n=1 Tax=Serratia ficaria TaxID=61651 RepID=UPI0036F2E3B2
MANCLLAGVGDEILYADYYRENISGTILDRPEQGRLLMDSHRNDILIERAHILSKYRGKQANGERHQKVMYLPAGKKLSIRETAEATGYSVSQACRIRALYKDAESA